MIIPARYASTRFPGKPLVEIAGKPMVVHVCERAARSAGLPPEKHGFKPHVTLARLKGTRPESVARVLEGLGAFQSAPFQVESFALFSSRPKVGGGPYVVEDTFELRGADYAGHWASDR